VSRQIAKARLKRRKNTDSLAETLIGSLHDVTVTYLREGKSPFFLPYLFATSQRQRYPVLITIVRHRAVPIGTVERWRCSVVMLLTCSIVLLEEDKYKYTRVLLCTK